MTECEETAAMYQDHLDGMSITEVAKKWGKSSATIYGRFRRHAIRLPSPLRQDGRGKSQVAREALARQNRQRSSAAARAKAEVCANIDTSGLSLLDRTVLLLRARHPDLSLAQLGALYEPPMTKDAYASRLRRVLSQLQKREMS